MFCLHELLFHRTNYWFDGFLSFLFFFFWSNVLFNCVLIKSMGGTQKNSLPFMKTGIMGMSLLFKILSTA